MKSLRVCTSNQYQSRERTTCLPVLGVRTKIASWQRQTLDAAFHRPARHLQSACLFKMFKPEGGELRT